MDSKSYFAHVDLEVPKEEFQKGAVYMSLQQISVLGVSQY